MAVIYSLSKGYDPWYPWEQMRRKSGDYFHVQGEPRGRWWGAGATALGLAPGSEIDRKDYGLVYAERLDRRDGVTRLGRSPRKAAERAMARYHELLGAEPEATRARQWELQKQAARDAHCGPLYMELTAEMSKSITVFYTSVAESARSARDSGDEGEAASRYGLLAELDEMIYEANQAALGYFEREAGYTRSGYHGRRVDGQETGHFDQAGLVMSQFLQHESRDDDPHLHVHVPIAQVARTGKDGRWRTPDTFGYNTVFPAVSGIGSVYLESLLTQRFGVEWVPRACTCEPRCDDASECTSAFGCEIKGISRAVMDLFSSRRDTITAEVRERAAKFERDRGRKPTQRELTDIHASAWHSTRHGKKEGPLDLDALYEESAERLRLNPATHGAELALIAEGVWDEQVTRSGSRSYDGDRWRPDAQALRRTALKALSRCQRRRPKWSRYDLLRELGAVMPPEARRMPPRRAVALLHELTERILAGEYEPVVCLEAPELADVPESLRRDDGMPLYRRHMSTRYATTAHLGLEERLLANAGRGRESLVEPERAAQLLGSDSATLSAQLERKAEAGSTATTATGLRLDQAAAIWSALAGRTTSVVITGPAGSGKTYTLAAAAKAATQAGVQHVYAAAPSQAARNALAASLARAGVRATVVNSTQFLDRVSRPATDRHRLVIAPGSLILTDEASMLPASHAAALKEIAAATGSLEITAGDQEQLPAPQDGGAMGLQARKHGYLQLTEPVRFTLPWERDATLRLRSGDVTVAGEYDLQGRIRSGTPEEVLEEAAQTAATLLADGQDVILMARSRDHVRELSRRVRGELVRLGLVGDGQTVPLAGGARASVHDLVVIRKNDHRAGLANGDIVRVEAIEDDGRVRIRKATGRDPVTGEPVFTGETMLRKALRQADPAYGRTVHTAQGGQGTIGLAVVTGNEDRQWLYPAMTRGTDGNYAFVMTGSPRTSEPAAGPRPAPELARFDQLARERAGQSPLPAAQEEAADRRDPAAVLADVIGRDGTELSATEYRERQLANADNLALLDPMWQDAVAGPRTERYRQMLADVLPPELAEGAADSPMATWLWRTLRAAEAAGLDARRELRAAVDTRPLSDARCVAAVVDARLRKQIDVDHLIPVPEGRWSDQVPQVDDPAEQKYLSQLAAAMDGRVERLGRFVASRRPQWAVEALGEVPGEPEARVEWERRAARVEAYRERFWDHPSEPIGPEPAMATPEKRAAWHAAAQALGRPCDGPDVRYRDTGSLWLIRDTYEAETAWAPRFVSPELRSMRLSARETELTRARAAAETRAAEAHGDHAQAQRQQRLARSSVALRSWYEDRAAELEQADADYREWEHATEGSRRLAVAADAELRRRDPGLALPPLRTAEPAPLTDAERAELSPEPEHEPGPEEQALAEMYERYAPELAAIEKMRAASPGWLHDIGQDRAAFRAQLAERQSIRVPDPDPDYGDRGPAWPPLTPRERDAVLQPPAPEMPPAPGTAREAELEAGA